ncbi:DUF2357 domain-containing protein [Succinimonas sp.]|uniref:DUF2357 domain-containing protein n=1 Tax=Succinimonas sp. TaxID=1936151 RepID=UPI003864EF33
MSIDSYEKFCIAFIGDPSQQEYRQANLILFLQDWMVTAAGWADEENRVFGLDRFLEQIANRPATIVQRKDVVSRLIDKSNKAVYRIAENMRSAIIRENVLQPVYKVREINSHGVKWLSRRPGRTVKEKIANSNASMMAVQRRQSVDTGENRLFIAFLREITDLINMKESSLSPDRIPYREPEFASKLFLILDNPDFSEIRRWENLPPNNTLLSDQYYGKIWRSWKEMKEIDEIVSEDAESLNQRLATLFFVLVLSEGKKFFTFPQVPVNVDYRSRKLQLCAPFFYGVNISGKPVRLNLKNSVLTIDYQGRKLKMTFKGDDLELVEPGNKISKFPLDADKLTKYAKIAIEKLGCSHVFPGEKTWPPEPVKCGKATVDFFQVRPHYIADNDVLMEMYGRILIQRHSYRLEDGAKPTIFPLPCDRARTIAMTDSIETYSVVSAVEEARPGQLADLARLLGDYIIARQLTFLFPDAYNEFQLSMVHKALRLAFQRVVSFPRSMGAVFSLMKSPRFTNTFTCGDFILVLDLSYDNLSLTLVQSSHDDKLAQDIPEFHGLIWERHPTAQECLSEEIKQVTDKLLEHGCRDEKRLYKLLGIQGLTSESGRLSIQFDKDSVFLLDAKTSLSGWSIPVTRQVNCFLDHHRQIIGDARVHIVSLSGALFYKGKSFKTIPYDDVIRGYSFFEKLQNRTSHMLWKEHLPELAIKLLYGKFKLVEDLTVQPAFNLEKKIPIKRRFTLTKGKNEYRFVLVSNDLNKTTQYVAVVKNPAFPLKQDVVCRLNMSYRYGAEDPYTLIFIPENPNADFAEARVSWEPATEYPYMGLPFPKPLLPISWDKLSSFDGRKGKIDLLNGKYGIVNFFRQVSKKYMMINLDDYQYSMQGEVGKRCFTLDITDRGQPIKVIFSEPHMEPTKDKAAMSFDNLHKISFQIEEDRSPKQKVRYFAKLKNRMADNIWRLDKTGKHFHIQDLKLDGKNVPVAFFEKKFLPGEIFSPKVSNVSFEIASDDKGRYRAENIHNEDMGPYQSLCTYYAKQIRRGDCPLSNLYNGWAFFLLHSVFVGGNSTTKTDTPPTLATAFENAKESWLSIYQRHSKSRIGEAILALMSLCAADLGNQYYMIANAKLDNIIENPRHNLTDNMGYALGACSSEKERALLERFLRLEDPLQVVCLLSKAAWGNPDFVINVNKKLLLDYFEKAAKGLKKKCDKKRFENWLDIKQITSCLEYILAVYRLRSLGDDNLNRFLSRNNPVIQELYRSLEIIVDAIIDGSLKIRSYLRLDIPNKGTYKDVPNLLYALLVYVTGDDTASDIMITGLSLDDIEM